MRASFNNLVTSILANILTPLVVLLLIAIAGLLYAARTFIAENLPTSLQLALIFLVLLNITISLYFVAQQRHLRLMVSLYHLDSLDILDSLKTLNEQQSSIIKTLTTPGSAPTQTQLTPEDEHRLNVREKLPLANKVFIDTTEPQSIHLEFCNTDASNNIFHIRTIKYRGSFDFPLENLSPRYMREDRYLIIPPIQKDIKPGEILPVDLDLRNKWRAPDINRLAGKWGTLYLEVTFVGEPLQLPYII